MQIQWYQNTRWCALQSIVNVFAQQYSCAHQFWCCCCARPRRIVHHKIYGVGLNNGRAPCSGAVYWRRKYADVAHIRIVFQIAINLLVYLFIFNSAKLCSSECVCVCMGLWEISIVCICTCHYIIAITFTKMKMNM